MKKYNRPHLRLVMADRFTTEQHQCVHRAIATALSDREARLVLARFWQSQTIEDLAKQFRVDWETADRMLNHSLSKLKTFCSLDDAFRPLLNNAA